VRRYEKKGKQKKEKIIEDNELIAFIDLLIDLFPYNPYRDWEKEIKALSKTRQIHIQELIFVL